jgi:hypothetical protein
MLNDLIASAELPPWAVNDTGLCRIDPRTKTEYPQEPSGFQSVSESRLGIIPDSA